MRALLFTLAVCATGAAVFASAVVAGQPVSQTLNPPAPSFETCKAAGTSTLCQGSRSEGGFTREPTGIVCGSGVGAFEILESIDDHVQHHAMRVYNADGNLVRRVFTDAFPGGEYINPLTDGTVPYSNHFVTTGVLTVPGDLSTEVVTVRGEWNFVASGMGAVFVNAGRVVYTATGDVVSTSGPQGFNDLFINSDPSAIDRLCAALRAA